MKKSPIRQHAKTRVGDLRLEMDWSDEDPVQNDQDQLQGLKGICDWMLEHAQPEDIIIALGSCLTDKALDGQEPYLDIKAASKLARMDALAFRLFKTTSDGF